MFRYFTNEYKLKRLSQKIQRTSIKLYKMRIEKAELCRYTKCRERKDVHTMAHILDVARYVLSRDSMTPKKLQKICYYCQGWHLAFTDGSPLFAQNLEAWVHGPVSPDLYSYYKGYRWDIIPTAEYPADGELTPYQKAVIDEVYKAYGPYSGDDLELLSHSEAPWIKARGDLEPTAPSNNVITLTSMTEFFCALAKKTQSEGP
jgi:uncharacterized phage-associated protein